MRLDRRSTNILWPASRPTFRCSGEFCATMISGRENSTPDTWIACSQKLRRRGHRRHGIRSRQSWKDRGDCLRHVCRAGAVGTGSKNGSAGKRARCHPTGSRRDARSAALILMVYEIVVSGERAVEQAGKLAASHTGSSWKKPRGMGVPTGRASGAYRCGPAATRRVVAAGWMGTPTRSSASRLRPICTCGWAARVSRWN